MILSIIVLNYNTKDLTISCIRSLIKFYKNEFEKGDFELILVDNASSDDSVNEFKKTIASINNARIIENKENFGFAKGNNIGASYAKGAFLLFLNSDTEMLNNGLLEMKDLIESRQNIAIIGGKTMKDEIIVEKTAGKFYTIFYLFLTLFVNESFVRISPNKAQSVDWVSGGFMMARKAYFDEIRGFDEHFFMYVEDMELCFRLRKKGYVVYFYPFASVIHKGQGSSNRTFAIINIYKGLLYFFKKHKSVIEYHVVKILLILKAYSAITIGKVTNNTYLKDTYQKALEVII